MILSEVTLILSYKSTTLGTWNVSEFQSDQRSDNKWNNCFSVFNCFFLFSPTVLVSIIVYILYTTKKGHTTSFLTHRWVQVLSFSGCSIKPRVVSDGNQSIHTCSCYTCVQSFIDSICQRKLDLDFGQRRLIIPNPNILFVLKSRPLLPILYFVQHVSSYCGCFCVKHS